MNLKDYKRMLKITAQKVAEKKYKEFKKEVKSYVITHPELKPFEYDFYEFTDFMVDNFMDLNFYQGYDNNVSHDWDDFYEAWTSQRNADKINKTFDENEEIFKYLFKLYDMFTYALSNIVGHSKYLINHNDKEGIKNYIKELDNSEYKNNPPISEELKEELKDLLIKVKDKDIEFLKYQVDEFLKDHKDLQPLKESFLEFVDFMVRNYIKINVVKGFDNPYLDWATIYLVWEEKHKDVQDKLMENYEKLKPLYSYFDTYSIPFANTIKQIREDIKNNNEKEIIFTRNELKLYLGINDNDIDDLYNTFDFNIN